MDRALEIELLDQHREVVGVSVHLVAVPRLARTTVTAPVMGDATVPVRGEKRHLVLEGVSTQRPSVAEDDGLSGSPVLIIDLCIVTGLDCRHVLLSFCGALMV